MLYNQRGDIRLNEYQNGVYAKNGYKQRVLTLYYLVNVLLGNKVYPPAPPPPPYDNGPFFFYIKIRR